MDGCTNEKLGRMLHDFELDLLSPEDRQSFELHLYECDHCATLVQEFMDSARIIRDDPEAREIIAEIAGQANDSSGSRARKKPFPFMKMLIAAAVVLVLALPSYLIWLQPHETAVTQTLELLPIRSGGGDVIYSNKGGDVKIVFFVSESFTGEAKLTISSIEGDTVIDRSSFSDFNNKGLGSIILPVSKFRAGNYILTISLASETGIDNRTYFFLVK